MSASSAPCDTLTQPEIDRLAFEEAHGYYVCGIAGCILEERHRGPCAFPFLGRRARKEVTKGTSSPPRTLVIKPAPSIDGDLATLATSDLTDADSAPRASDEVGTPAHLGEVNGCCESPAPSGNVLRSPRPPPAPARKSVFASADTQIYGNGAAPAAKRPASAIAQEAGGESKAKVARTTSKAERFASTQAAGEARRTARTTAGSGPTRLGLDDDWCSSPARGWASGDAPPPLVSFSCAMRTVHVLLRGSHLPADATLAMHPPPASQCSVPTAPLQACPASQIGCHSVPLDAAHRLTDGTAGGSNHAPPSWAVASPPAESAAVISAASAANNAAAEAMAKARRVLPLLPGAPPVARRKPIEGKAIAAERHASHASPAPAVASEPLSMAKVHDAAVALLMFGEAGDAAADATAEPSRLPSLAASTVSSPTRPTDTDAAAPAGRLHSVSSYRSLDQSGDSQSQPSTRAVSPIPQPTSFHSRDVVAQARLAARTLTPVRAARLSAATHGPAPPPPSPPDGTPFFDQLMLGRMPTVPAAAPTVGCAIDNARRLEAVAKLASSAAHAVASAATAIAAAQCSQFEPPAARPPATAVAAVTCKGNLLARFAPSTHSPPQTVLSPVEGYTPPMATPTRVLMPHSM